MFPGANASEKKTDPEARKRCEVAEYDNTTFFSPFRSPDTATSFQHLLYQPQLTANIEWRKGA